MPTRFVSGTLQGDEKVELATTDTVPRVGKYGSAHKADTSHGSQRQSESDRSILVTMTTLYRGVFD